jgi:hypothetical protein
LHGNCTVEIGAQDAAAESLISLNDPLAWQVKGVPETHGDHGIAGRDLCNKGFSARSLAAVMGNLEHLGAKSFAGLHEPDLCLSVDIAGEEQAMIAE